MSSWAASAPRTFMNDANRNRFSIVPPPFENYKDSHGPGTYNPKVAFVRPKSSRAHVSLVPDSDGVPLRVKQIYGVPVSKILPIHALSYTPRGQKESPFDAITSEGERPQFVFTSQSQRQLWPKTDITAHPEEYPPGPLAYGLPDISLVTSRCPTAIVDTREVRECNSPVERDPLPHLSQSKMSVYRTPPRTQTCTPLNKAASWRSNSPPNNAALIPSPPQRGESPRRPQVTQFGSTLASLGGTIGHSPRHLNIHNINSNLRRELDADFDNPPPGAYDVPAPSRRSAANSPTSSVRRKR